MCSNCAGGYDGASEEESEEAMTSHEFARELQKTVDHLLARAEVEIDMRPYLYLSFYEKEKFLAAALTMGSGKKEFTEHEFRFCPGGTCITMSIARSKVCRKVQEEKWECEPLFSEEEVGTVG